MRAKTYIFGAVFAVAWVSPAHAYRPFDGTDADVLGHGEVEFELGYLHLLREGSQTHPFKGGLRHSFGETASNADWRSCHDHGCSGGTFR
jgi:hypothetical protein